MAKRFFNFRFELRALDGKCHAVAMPPDTSIFNYRSAYKVKDTVRELAQFATSLLEETK